MAANKNAARWYAHLVGPSKGKTFLRSSLRFVYRVARRSIAAIILVLLKFSDLYSQVLSPRLASPWNERVYAILQWLDQFTYAVIFLIVLGAILWTYWEADRAVRREPSVVKELQRFYVRSDQLLRMSVADDTQLAALKIAIQDFYAQVTTWVKASMEPASLARLAEQRMGMPYRHPSGKISDEHQRWVNGLCTVHENIRALIESDEWR
jgi:hypothetical protein